MNGVRIRIHSETMVGVIYFLLPSCNSLYLNLYFEHHSSWNLDILQIALGPISHEVVVFQIDLQDGVSDGLEHEPHVLRVCKQMVNASHWPHGASADLWRWCGGCRSSSGASAGAGSSGTSSLWTQVLVLLLFGNPLQIYVCLFILILSILCPCWSIIQDCDLESLRNVL